jgi:putative ABC transport system permease protein
MREDFRFALRQLRKNPAFAAIAVVTLGLGIGAAAAMFGLIQGVLLSPPPYADPGRLVLITPARTDGKPFRQRATVGQWQAWRQARSIEAPAMYGWTFNFLVLPDGSQSMGGMVVTPSYFKTLGLKPILGREFTEGELSRPKVQPSAVILGYDLWQRKFNGDPAIVGKTIRISRMAAPLPVVGVMPRGIRFLPDQAASSEPNYDLNAFVDFWLGITIDESRPTNGVGNMVARLRDGATAPEAQAELAAMSGALAQSDPALEGVTAIVAPVQDVLNRDGRRLLVPLFGSVGLVFFIACANVTGLLLTRGLQRQPEYAMRSALGAARWRLFRQALTESLVLALAGAALGAALASGIVVLLKTIAGQAVPRADAVHVGWPVFGFGLLASILAAGVAGLLPAARASLPDRLQGLKGTRTTAGRSERRLLGAVATLQIVLTIALLSGAALLVRTARNLDRMQPGYDTQQILAMTVTAMDRQKSTEFHKLALQRAASVPGVTNVAFAWGVPLTGNKWIGEIQFPDQLPSSSRLTDRANVPIRSITEDYFGVMGMRVAEGRAFRETDGQDAPRVAIVNEALAKRYYPGRAALGAHFAFTGSTDKPVEIVGIIADTRTEDLSAAAEPEIYMPFWQSGAFSKHLVVRASGDPIALAALIRNELRQIEPTSAVERVTTMAEIRRDSVAPRTFAMRLLIGFAVVATVLALVGLYGVLSLSVNSRVKEIAVRKAVGAQEYQIARLVLGDGSKLIAGGLVLGAVGAVFVGRLLRTLLFDVTPSDPIALGLAAIVFAVVGLAACALPALRASRVDLMESLRQE